MNPGRTSPEPLHTQRLRQSFGAREAISLIRLAAVLLFWIAPPCVDSLPLKIRKMGGLLKLTWWFISSYLCSKGTV